MKSLNVSSLDVGDTERSVLAQVALAAAYLVLAVLATVGNVCVFIINFRWRGGLSKFKNTSDNQKPSAKFLYQPRIYKVKLNNVTPAVASIRARPSTTEELVRKLGRTISSFSCYVKASLFKSWTSSQQKITSIFLLNLALTDIGIAVLNLPFAFVSICLNRWVFGRIFCVINGFIALYLPVVSIMTVLLITIHRSIVVLYPFKKIITKQVAFVLCGVCWIWVLLVPIPPLFGISHYEFSPQRGFCRAAFVQYGIGKEAKAGNLYSVVSVTIFVIIPLFVISVLNIILLFTSWKLQLNMPVPVYSQHRDSARRKSTLLGDQKAFRTVSLVVGAFILCWLPQVFITFIGIGVKDPDFPPHSLATFQALLVMANSTMNPFIYTYVNKDFRSRFVQILLCRILGHKRFKTNGSVTLHDSVDNSHNPINNNNHHRQSIKSNTLLPIVKHDSSCTELNSPIVEDDPTSEK